MSELEEGLRNKEDVLNLCRLMVRAEDPEHRIQILKCLEVIGKYSFLLTYNLNERTWSNWLPLFIIIQSKLRWLEHPWDYDNLLETGVLRAIEG